MVVNGRLRIRHCGLLWVASKGLNKWARGSTRALIGSECWCNGVGSEGYMGRVGLNHLAVLVGIAVTMFGCLEQYDPRPNNARLNHEWKQSVVDVPKLTATGELPAAGGPVVNIDERYTTLCSSCHGATGGGDGPGAAALSPKPRNFHDKGWQAKVDDAHLAKVITSGGASVGLSAMMAPWGAVLSTEEVQLMVKKVRSFGSP